MDFPTISKFSKKIPRKGSGLYYDPLYGYVPLPDYIREAMDLEVFQRLRGIKQLSTVYLTFPGAVHTRFDHCVGTAYLSSIMFEKIRELVNPSEPDTPQLNLILEACMYLSSLFHDVGHGPFCHVFEMFCRREKKFSEWTHEKMGRKLITGKDENNVDIPNKAFKQIREFLEKIKNRFSLIEPDADNLELLSPSNIYNIASGKSPELGEPNLDNKYYFLKDIIASSYGLDRLDYLKRDAYFSGVNTGNIDIGEIISSLLLINFKGKYGLFLKSEAITALETLLQARNLVYRRLYHNSVHRSAQELIIRGLISIRENPEKICLFTDNEILTLFSEKGGLSTDINERVKFRILFENIHLCNHLFIRKFKSELSRYSETEGEWIKLKNAEDSIAEEAGMNKDNVFYDTEIIPAVKSEDFTKEVFFDEIEGQPKSLFDLAEHLKMIYGGDVHPGYERAEYFNESVSDIIVCFPYDSIIGKLEELKTKTDEDLTEGIETLYRDKIEPIIKGFFKNVLKVLETDGNFFKKAEIKKYFLQLKQKCFNYLLALAKPE
ncbi:hypothetical protein ES703_55222 [subsurface metagenome]